MSGGSSAKVSVVGAGGIGCALGHGLRAGGVDVTFVDSDEKKVHWGNDHGVGLGDQPLLSARFVRFEDWQPASSGIVLLCTKSYDNEAVLGRLPASVSVIPVQNGFDRKLMDRCRVEGIASFVSECSPHQTHTRITRSGSLHVGPSVAGEGEPVPSAAQRLIAVLEQHGSFRVKRVPNVLPYKHAKLMYNAAISPLAAVAGLDNGRLLTNATARKLFFTLLRENYRILKGAGVELGKIGPFHPDTVDRILRLPLVARAMAWPFSLTLRNTYCSMSGDLPTGRTEIDAYNGHLIGLAGDTDCPLNRRVYALVKRLERERCAPAIHRLDELLPSQ